MVRVDVSSVVRGLSQKQAPKLLQGIARQIDVPINIERLKTGIVNGYLVGIDDAGRFIATHGERLPNGNFGTQSCYGLLDSGGYSKIISEFGGKTQKSFFAELSEKLGKPFNMSRTKIGFVNGKQFGIDYESGRFILANQIEQIPKGELGVCGQTGVVQGFGISKEIPKSELLSFRING